MITPEPATSANPKTYVLQGTLKMGFNSILLDEHQQCIEYFERDVPPLPKLRHGRYVYRSGQHRLVSLENKKSKKIVGTRGHCKAYIQTSEKEGIILFHERLMASKTYEVWQKLSKRGLAPEGVLRRGNINLALADCKKKWFREFSGPTPYMLVGHINYPKFLYDLRNGDHCAVLYGEKEFGISSEDILNSPFWSKSVDEMVAKYEFMNKINMSKKHPNLSSEKFVLFCEKIGNLLNDEPDFAAARPSKMKWGNILYCLNAKKWYWVDC